MNPSAPLEIERKFLVEAPPPGLDGHPRTSIRQGYLALDADGTEVRLRRKGARFIQTVKQGQGLARPEVEIELTPAQFEALWPMTAGKRLAKIRYLVPYEDHQIELDVYEGALSGLMTAEVEFPAREAAMAFTPPPWLGREVTGEAVYTNRHLATYGLPGG